MTRPPQSNPLAHLVHALAKAASSAVDVAAQQQQAGAQAKGKPGCTPCAAMARRRKARRLVGG